MVDAKTNETWKADEIKTKLKEKLEERLNIIEVKRLFKMQNFIEKYYKIQYPVWIDNAINAMLFYQENEQFTIEKDKTFYNRIVPVDWRNTGVLQHMTNWDDGIHQFLQIRYNLKITPEQICTNFISNVSFIRKNYIRKDENNILALTGTIGSEKTRNILFDIYKCKTLEIPSSNAEKKIIYFDKHCKNEEEWLQTIYESCEIEAKRERAVLVACETILKARKVKKYLDDNNNFNLFKQVKLFVKDLKIDQKAIGPREIIIGTTLIGRGKINKCYSFF